MPRLIKQWIFQEVFENEDSFQIRAEVQNVSRKPFRTYGKKKFFRCANYKKYQCKFEIKTEAEGVAAVRVFHCGEHNHDEQLVKPRFGVDKDTLKILDEVRTSIMYMSPA